MIVWLIVSLNCFTGPCLEKEYNNAFFKESECKAFLKKERIDDKADCLESVLILKERLQ